MKKFDRQVSNDYHPLKFMILEQKMKKILFWNSFKLILNTGISNSTKKIQNMKF